MAEMIPPVFGRGPACEQQVFRVLETTLSPEWVVWWSLSYSQIAGDVVGGGEIDFVCLHPAHGIVVLEIKGGEIDYRAGQWYQDGRKLPVPPEKQLAKNRHALLHYLKRGLHQSQVTFPVASAVWFPGCSRIKTEPTGLMGLMLYSNDLHHPEAALLNLLARDSHPMSAPIDVDQIKTLLSPTISFQPGWIPRRTLREAQLAKLTQEQATTFDAFSQFPGLRIRGCAGSGKTLLALRHAMSQAAEGKRVLLLCFNLLLADHLKRLTASYPQITTAAVNDFLCDLLKRTPTDSAEFWHQLAYDAVAPAQILAETNPYDTIIVDEGQDFAPRIWKVVKGLVAEKTRLIVFYDPAQNIFCRDLSELPEFPWPEAVLTLNCRNARSVADVLLPYAPNDLRISIDAPSGEPAEFYSATTRKGLRARLNHVLKRLTEEEHIPLQDILLIGAHVVGRMDLGETLAEFPGLRYFTYRKFKGLEAPVLILLDVTDKDPLWNDSAKYTAISRAIHKVIVLNLTSSR